jgi:hypothetical protein
MRKEVTIQLIPLFDVVRSPDDPVSIEWEVDGASGSTQCEAWRGQHEIEGLERAGHTIVRITVNGIEVYSTLKLKPVDLSECEGRIHPDTLDHYAGREGG